MNTITQISIPQPCSQSWNDMTAAEGGRFCMSCSKTVIDFAGMGNQQIIDYLSGNNKTCGKFSSGQIAHINNHLTDNADLQHASFFKKSVVFIGLLLATYYAKAQTNTVKPSTEQARNIGVLGEVDIVKDTTAHRVVSGKITNEMGLPVVGVNIKSDNGRINSVSDSNGFYQINLPANIKTLTISSVGYNQQIISVNPALGNNFNATLKEIDLQCFETVLVGGIIVKKAPFYKRWYHRFIKRPVERIFR